MTTNVVRVPGNYQITAGTNGTITLDTGVNTGTVVVTGNLDVRGQTTTIESTNATIKDNQIVLNAGETNSYVSLGTAGIIIDRGNSANLANAALIQYNDAADINNVTWSTPDGKQGRGIFEFKTGGAFGAVKFNLVRIDEATAPGAGKTGTYPSLNFFGYENKNSVLSVAGANGALNYEDRIGADDDVPNIAWVKQWVSGQATTARVDQFYAGTPPTYVKINSLYGTSGWTNPSEVVIGIDGADVYAFSKLRTVFPGLAFTPQTISAIDAVNTNTNLILEPQGNGTVNVQRALRITNQAIPPEANTNTTAIYATGTVGAGGTGLYYANQNAAGEFISRKRAIIYGLIF
jgi:hypothetical protein